jgi:hypothetical protein
LLIALVTRTSPISAHEWSRLATVESLVERQTYELDGSSFADTRDKIFNRGHFYSHQPPLLATIEAPVYAVLHAAGLRFSNNAPFNWAFYLFVLFTNGLAFALTVVVLDRVFALVAIPGRARAFYALMLPLGTWLLPYGAVSDNHGVSALLLAFAIYLLLAIETHGAGLWRYGLLGGAMGLVSVIEVLPLVSFVPLVAVHLASRADARGPANLLVTAVAFLLPLLAHAALNIPITGDVIPAGFHFELFNYPGSPFDASTLSGDVKMRPAGELFTYANEAMFTHKGFFTLAPVMLIGLLAGILGWTWWRRFRGVHLVLVGGTVASLAVSLLTTNNFGGVAVGFRHATYLAPAFVILLLPVLASRQWARAAASAIGLVAGGSAVVLMVYAVRWPWEDLVFPLNKPLGPWQSYMPVVGHLLTNVP